MAQTYNQKIADLLKAGGTYTAHRIVRYTDLSFATVRRNLNLMRDRGLIDRDLDVGLNGHTLYQWYWIGGE